jgi:MFS family permease
VLCQRRPAIILAGILLYGAGYGVFISVLPISLTGTNEFDAAAVSVLFVVFYAAISFAQIVAGPMSDRIGRQGFMIWGMLTGAIGLGAFLLFPGVWVYIPLGLASVGLGIFCVTSIAELNDRVADDFKGAISGSYYFFWALGYVLGPLLIGALASRSPWIGYSVLALALAIHSAVVWLSRE